ncbi:type I restriction-modification system subunit M N-terminal domain-containing protein [Synechococcus sp. CCY9201]|uniref:type I restriction-modification system subunit M N-terminal domain-containing protein n=1 Tax=Synechococcus sp. CCY9201 TaxID=174697 RepID=UPI002B20F90D|nr:type I restriction-modification system subunit M N-terminal domain-containing protein [Synechococcus sp. CCY9201]MEA5472970.1 type I restriction-modification system subunit M N-terminal domain-containing protein [Synechococcus sp. CCY9201]
MTTAAPLGPQPTGKQNLSAFIWSVADLLRGDYKQSDYGKVILPFTVLRRLDCVLEPFNVAALEKKVLRIRCSVPGSSLCGKQVRTPEILTTRYEADPGRRDKHQRGFEGSIQVFIQHQWTSSRVDISAFIDCQGLQAAKTYQPVTQRSVPKSNVGTQSRRAGRKHCLALALAAPCAQDPVSKEEMPSPPHVYESRGQDMTG